MCQMVIASGWTRPLADPPTGSLHVRVVKKGCGRRGVAHLLLPTVLMLHQGVTIVASPSCLHSMSNAAIPDHEQRLAVYTTAPSPAGEYVYMHAHMYM